MIWKNKDLRIKSLGFVAQINLLPFDRLRENGVVTKS